MYPIQGQIVKIKAQSNINYIIAETAKGILEHCQSLEPNLKNVENRINLCWFAPCKTSY